MLEFKKLTIDDKTVFDKYLKPYTFQSCEYSFTNLFIWRKACEIEYAIIDNALIIKKKDFSGKYHFMQPIGYEREALSKIVEELMIYKDFAKMDYLFKDLEDNFINEFKECIKGEYTVEEDRDNFDYVYPSGSLITLAGKKLHAKKNHYNQFIKNYEYNVKEIEYTMLEECLVASKEWWSNREEDEKLKYELDSIEDLIKHSIELELKGMAVYVQNKLSAFAIGEKMNNKMAIIHIEKADSNIKGLYTFINKTFIENYFSDVEFINREQDLGKEGLRKAKESYKPYEFVKKYIIKDIKK